MTLLQKLKSLLGLGESRREQRSSRDVGVTVERESADTSAGASEREADEEAEGGEPDERISDVTVEDGEPTSATERKRGDSEPTIETETQLEDSEAAPETETQYKDSEARDDTDDAMAAGPTAAKSTDSAADTSEQPETAPQSGKSTDSADDTAPETETADGPTGEPVNSIKGIGPAYADRLASVGIETVDDLAGRDAEALSEQTDISPKRLQGWIDRANVR